jgi:hypothetical protein
MFRIYTLSIVYILLICFNLSAQSTSSQITVTSINPLPVSNNTGDKPQSKVWNYSGKWWAVLPDSRGTHVWRLDGNSWKDVLLVSTNRYAKADCKVVGNVVHILLFRGDNKTNLVSIEYESALNSYKLWSKRSSLVVLVLGAGAETATMDIDGKGRMWVAYDGRKAVNVRWSAPPYLNWSSPITLATGIKDDDICAIIAMPGKVGVFWSNQNSKKFGFRTHKDGADPGKWSADEVPAAHSAQNVGMGMADDHINIAVAKNGTLYCAVKTGYETTGYPKLGLLVRRPAGTWDKLYQVTEMEGTRPIVILNEALGILKVVYTDVERGGNILYREASMSCLTFGSPATLMRGTYNYTTSMKQSYSSEVLIMATDITLSSLQASAVLVKDEAVTGGKPTTPCEIEENVGKPKLLAYPNPFLSTTTIQFYLPDGEAYVINLYDAKGAIVAKAIRNVSVAGGLNKVTLDGSDLPRGLYVVKLQSGEGIQSVKLILER